MLMITINLLLSVLFLICSSYSILIVIIILNVYPTFFLYSAASLLHAPYAPSADVTVRPHGVDHRESTIVKEYWSINGFK